MKNKRVVQISLDLIVGCECNGEEYAESIANELERTGFKVVGAAFQEDMTEVYEEQYSNLLNEWED